ncbi:flagellar basal body L-ring protein FlgH [Vibrio breoganii]
MRLIRKTILVVACMALSACSTMKEDFIPPEPDTQEYAPAPVDYKVERVSKGSLYAGGSSVFQDKKAYRVGDILTVQLDEQTESNKSSSTTLGKSSATTLTAPSFGGNSIDSMSANLSGDRSFDGAAASKQGNRLSGSITVTVYEVLPNGVLRIRGEKWLKLNQGDEFIRLSGNVRVEDIDADNMLSSTRIADARITYSGRGALADSNKPGWLTQFFTSPWMPF